MGKSVDRDSECKRLFSARETIQPHQSSRPIHAGESLELCPTVALFRPCCLSAGRHEPPPFGPEIFYTTTGKAPVEWEITKDS